MYHIKMSAAIQSMAHHGKKLMAQCLTLMDGNQIQREEKDKKTKKKQTKPLNPYQVINSLHEVKNNMSYVNYSNTALFSNHVYLCDPIYRFQNNNFIRKHYGLNVCLILDWD